MELDASLMADIVILRKCKSIIFGRHHRMLVLTGLSSLIKKGYVGIISNNPPRFSKAPIIVGCSAQVMAGWRDMTTAQESRILLRVFGETDAKLNK